MATQKSPYEKWQDGINASKTDARWDEYDADIKSATTEFNVYLANTKGYATLDWKLIKAMVWTESGGPDATMWKIRAMQIGNPGDPGLDSLLSDKEGGDLILSPLLKTQITKASANTPSVNIRAGIGYLLMRAATYATASVEDAIDKKITEIEVKAGDNPSKIAAANHSTLDMLKKLNPQLLSGSLHIGQKVKVQKASMKKGITGWATINTQFAATKYNVGDSFYRQKLDYCISIMK